MADEIEKENPTKNVVEEDKQDEDQDSSEEELGLLEKPIEILETRRERKKVERLSLVNEPKTPKREELDYSKGRGIKLGDIEIVKYELDRTAATELKPLHKLLYRREGKVTMIKKNIRAFCGFPFEKGTKEYGDLEWAMEKFTNVGLKRLCEIFGLSLAGKRDELKEKILEFLMEPHQTNKKIPVKVVKKQKKKAKKKKSEPSAAKSPKKKKSKEQVEGAEEEDEEDEADVAASEGDDEEEQEDGVEEKKKKESEKAKKKEPKSKTKKSKATIIKLPTPSKKRKEKAETPKKKSTPKKAKKQETEDSSDDEPLAKKSKTDAPTDEDLKSLVKKLLDGADLETVTMKMICKKVFDNFPGHDLTARKSFIKETVKQIIS